MRPVLDSEHHGGSVRTIRSSWNINDVTIDVIELERSPEDDRIEVKRAWVFHDDIFILLTQDNKLFTSVEVRKIFLELLIKIYHKGVYYTEYQPNSTVSEG